MPASLPWWLLPALAALLLVASHTYLGLHVVARNVFFVDLALAQIAALGSTVAFLYGYEANDPVTYAVSLLFAIGGAWFFSAAHDPEDRIPQEAIIGLAFAVASAGAILLSTKNPHGAEHLKDMMAGSILVVSRDEVLHAAWLYAAVGAVHWVFRRQFLLISMDRAAAQLQGMRVKRWDFFFYLTFALVITYSVRIAGVLLVFILLIGPAICGAMFSPRVRTRLLVGWACGALAVIGGLALSWNQDWPPAPAISCVVAILLLSSAVVRRIAVAPRRGWAAAKVAGLGVGLVGAGFLLRGALAASMASPPPPAAAAAAEHGMGTSRGDLLAALLDEHENVRANAAAQLGQLGDRSVSIELVKALSDPSSTVREAAAVALGRLGEPGAAPGLSAALAKAGEDDWLRLREAEALLRCSGLAGMDALLDLAARADAGLVRREALKLALGFAGRAAADGAAAETTLADLQSWWSKSAGRLRWDASQERLQEAR